MGFDGSEIDTLLSEAVANGAFDGVVAMVVEAEGALSERAFGEAGPETMFRNASMTKAVTTTGALQLLERDLLRLDQTVESVPPEFGRLQVLEGFDGERSILRPSASKATIRQLMTHTAGLGYGFLNERLLRWGSAVGLPRYPFAGKKISLSAPLLHDPGTVWESVLPSIPTGGLPEGRSWMLSGSAASRCMSSHSSRCCGLAVSRAVQACEQPCTAPGTSVRRSPSVAPRSQRLQRVEPGRTIQHAERSGATVGLRNTLSGSGRRYRAIRTARPLPAREWAARPLLRASPARRRRLLSHRRPP